MAPRIVVVDDSEDVRFLLALAARQSGVEVVAEAGTAEQGMAMVRMTRPDAVVLDNVMPGMHGVDAVAAMRLASPATVIVMYSSDPNPEVRHRALREGAAAYLEKLVTAPAGVIETCLRLIAGDH